MPGQNNKSTSEKKAPAARQKSSTARELQVGDVVTICIKRADKLNQTGEQETYLIGDCGERDLNATPKKIGREAPKIAGLMGQCRGEYHEVMIGNVRRHISIVKIERPER